MAFYQPSYKEEPQFRTYKTLRHRRFNPYPRNMTSLQRTEDGHYRAVLERPAPIMGLANLPVHGVVDFRVPGQGPVGERRAEGCLVAILRFMFGLRQNVEWWLGSHPADTFPQPEAADDDT